MTDKNNDHKIVKFEYNQITPRIYIGTNQCCRTHFKGELLKKGITADLSLEDKMIDAPFGVKYYLWLPVPDHFAPTFDQLEVGVSFLNILIERKHKIYVHCQHGHGRAPTLVAGYLAYKGMAPEAALKLIKAKRPGSHLNKKQMNVVRKFAQYVSVKESIF